MSVKVYKRYGDYRKLFSACLKKDVSKGKFIDLSASALYQIEKHPELQKEIATSMCGFIQFEKLNNDMLTREIIHEFCDLELPDKHIPDKEGSKKRVGFLIETSKELLGIEDY